MTKKERENLVEKLIIFARSFEGVPYKYGATMDEAPTCFDCSGFIKFVFGHFGYDLPRSTLLQATYAGKQVRDISKIKPGDLLFYRSIRGHYNPQYPGGIGHVVIYLGNKRAIHANSTVIKDYPVRIEKGEVRIHTLKDIERKWKEGPIVTVKRII